jgi:cellulose synthase/poly-beta-1,6-N-acetylglucosamine synthase-like glycosyltransferase
MWQILFWFSVGVIFYAYFGYPALLFIVSKIKRKHFASDDEYSPSVCLFISAFNEEKVIRRKIENSLDLDYPKERLRILVASDGSTDRTAGIVADYEDLGVELYNSSVRQGKSAVINDVMKEIREDVVVFTDANSLFARDALGHLVRHFADERIGCVVGKLRYADRHMSSVGRGEGVYWRYESRISMLESSLGSVLVANGSIFAIRRRLFCDIYPEVANDFQLPIEIGSRGYAVIYEPKAQALERATIFWHEEFQRKVRIVLRGITGFSMLAGRFRGLRLWQFFSHKLLRWMIGLFLVTAFASNAVMYGSSRFYSVVFVLQALFYVLAFNGWRLRKAKRTRKVFYIPFYFTMVNFAAMTGVIRFFLGQRQSIWEKAESARFSPVHTRTSSGEAFLGVGLEKKGEGLQRPRASVKIAKH